MGMGEQAAQRARVEPSPAHGDEEGVLRIPYEARAPVLEVTAQPVRSFLAQRNDALLVALALHAHCLLLEVDVSEIEPDRLRAAQAGRVDELDERTVAQREWLVAGQALEEGVHLVALGRLG